MLKEENGSIGNSLSHLKVTAISGYIACLEEKIALASTT